MNQKVYNIIIYIYIHGIPSGSSGGLRLMTHEQRTWNHFPPAKIFWVKKALRFFRGSKKSKAIFKASVFGYVAQSGV